MIWRIDLTRRPQVGRWTCACAFTATTAEQYADAEYVSIAEGRTMLIALLAGCLKAWREAGRLRALTGQREAKGWM